MLDAAGSRRVVLFGASEGGPACIKFAADHPDRVAGLILFASLAKGSARQTIRTRCTPISMIRGCSSSSRPGAGLPASRRSRRVSPAMLKARAWWAGLLRAASSPGAIKGVLEALRDTDVRHLLGRVSVPTPGAPPPRRPRRSHRRRQASRRATSRRRDSSSSTAPITGSSPAISKPCSTASGNSSAISRNNVVRFLIKRGAREILMRTKSHTATPTAALALGLSSHRRLPSLPMRSSAPPRRSPRPPSARSVSSRLPWLSRPHSRESNRTRSTHTIIHATNSRRSWANGAHRSIRINRCRTCRDKRSTLHATT